MPIVDITGFGNDEVLKMRKIRIAIQVAFKERFAQFGVEKLDDTNVTFSVDPSIESSLNSHIASRIYTRHFQHMSNLERDKVCDVVYLLAEEHGGHIYNEAFSPGFSSMRGRWNPDFIER